MMIQFSPIIEIEIEEIKRGHILANKFVMEYFRRTISTDFDFDGL